MSETMISEEMAIQQLNLVLDYYDIDPDDFKDLQVDDNSAVIAYERIISKLKKAIKRGKLEIKEDDNRPFITQYLDRELKGNVKELRYKPITGNAKMEMDKYKENTGKLYGLLGVLSGVSKTEIQKLEGRDLALAEYIGALFLLV